MPDSGSIEKTAEAGVEGGQEFIEKKTEKWLMDRFFDPSSVIS